MEPKTLLLFDGVCGLCDRAVRFFLVRDRKSFLCFAPLQGETAQQLRKRHPDLGWDLKTIFLVENWQTSQERIYQRSEAVLKALSILGGMWKVISWMLRKVPRTVRNRVYDWIAKNRYCWFAKNSKCELNQFVGKERFYY